MYERFTDRSRKVMQLANQEAARLNHEYIGTDHILLGLVKEGGGIAASLLANLDVDLRKIRLEVEKRVQPGQGNDVIMGRLPHTPRAKKVIEYAIEEARLLNTNYVGTEHLLFGLVRENEGVAAQVLNDLGVTMDKLKADYALLMNPSQTRLEELYRLKEEAVVNQDFELATKYRDEADALKKEQKSKLDEGQTKRDAEEQAEETLRKLTCVLLFHLTGQQTAQETLRDVRGLLESDE